MIVTEFYRTREDGTNLVRTYSDKGYMIERNGVVYEEAIDPENSGRVYIETETPTENEATEVDYISALEDLGVNFNG